MTTIAQKEEKLVPQSVAHPLKAIVPIIQEESKVLYKNPVVVYE